jgi:5'-3' exoribonuclease 1
MGIPSYFSQIIKKYPHILETFIAEDFKIDNLYFDSNSIIYDVVNNTPYQNNITEYENNIIQLVFEKICFYIQLINPRQTVYITFDGVAPMAKLEQQRQRRYKSWYINKMKQQLQIDEQVPKWNTASITPGTNFMKKLNNDLKQLLEPYFTKMGLEFLYSGSDQKGEGEHKIFEYIRDTPIKHLNETTIIYGLDADLIMLCLLHTGLCKKLYLYRDTPNYISSINSELNKDSNYILDIEELSKNLFHKFNIINLSNEENMRLINDYILICFMLGNDFMPHFPSLNLRTYGMDNIMNAYNAICINEKLYIINENNEINWKIYRKFIEYLCEKEEGYLKKEAKYREKLFYRTKFKQSTKEEKFDSFMNYPIARESNEKYINYNNHGWKQSYYFYLFKLKYLDEDRIKQISLNYLEGLEWNFKYYKKGLVNNTWKYNYVYPPLLTDLYKSIPYFDVTFCKNEFINITPEIQLLYVLPQASHQILPSKLKKIAEKHTYLFPETIDNIYSEYFRYFWEVHFDLPDINIYKLEELIV